MLVGYVSDERYVAIRKSARVRSRRSIRRGALAGYGVGLRGRDARPEVQGDAGVRDFGFKSVYMAPRDDRPYHFRLLRDGLRGTCGPSGSGPGRDRNSACTPWSLPAGLYRYGRKKELIRNIGWYDEHGPRATMQITPDGDYTGPVSIGTPRDIPIPPTNSISRRRKDPACTTSTRLRRPAVLSSPGSSRPPRRRRTWPCWPPHINWNAYNNFGGRSNYIHADAFPTTPTVNARYDLKRYTDSSHRMYSADDYAPLSFDRPEPINHVPMDVEATDMIRGRAACHVAPAEWRFLAWMERKTSTTTSTRRRSSTTVRCRWTGTGC